MTTPDRYLRARRPVRALNRVVEGLTALGLSLWGTRVLAVRGRISGVWRTAPVNVLTLDGQRYFVAPRGHTQWVRNLRVAGGGELRLGRHVEVFTAQELDDDGKPPVLRAYLRRWAFEVRTFFDGVDATAPDHVLRSIAPGYPVFRLD